MNRANNAIIKFVQAEHFSEEIKALTKNYSISKTSKIIRLAPFLDKNKILRVGSRIKHANVNYDAKYQILLPSNSNFTDLLIKFMHQKSLHGGPNMTETAIRQRYWIIGGQRTVKKVLSKCKRCHKYNPKTLTQFMADLPAIRVNEQLKPFTNCAIDYTGAVTIKASKIKNAKRQKAYVAIFVCMSTKAMHIELVSDLTADAFIAALRRVTSRRGAIKNIFSDNATNFCKSNKMLDELTEIEKEEFNIKIENELLKNSIKWNFSPPSAPHFNGLAEAGVKSVKFHLKRVIHNTILTFEEISTLLYQIEACVNSRPLCKISSDPNDTSILTPGHFLIGTSFFAIPDENLIETNANWLTRWQLVQKISQSFWKRWKTEYLSQLQSRVKWFKKNSDVPKINDLVLIKDDNSPSCNWPMAKVIQIYEGDDELTRVVKLKTKDNILKRPITKIAPLPYDSEEIQKSHVNIAHVHKPKQKNHILPIITAMLAVCVTLSHTTRINTEMSPFNVTKFDTDPGLFFELQSDLHMSYTNWNIIAFFDLNTFTDQLFAMKNNLNKIRSTCYTKLLEDNACKTMTVLLDNEYNDIAQKNEMLRSLKRQKRATLHIVGDLLGDLFGIMDSRSKEQYSKDLSKITQNENHLVNLMKNHTSIIESTLNVVKDTQTEIEQQAHQIEFLSTNIEKLADHNEAYQYFYTAALYMSKLMNLYEKQQDAIINSLHDASNNNINQNILNETQLLNQIEIISRNIDSSLIVPNDMNIFKIIKIKPYILNNNIVFKISVPLLSNYKFQLFKIIPIPALENNQYVWIEIENEYMIASVERQYYQFLNNIQLKDCMSFVIIRKNYIIHTQSTANGTF